MRIDYEISEQDFIAGSRLLTKSSPNRGLRWMHRAPWLGGALLAFIIYNCVINKQEFTKILPGLVIPAFLIAWPFLTRRANRKIYARNPAMHGRLSLEADDAGVRFQGPAHASQLDWSLYSRLLEDKDSFILLQQNQLVGNVVPKRSLSADEISDLRELFERKVGSRTNLPRG